MQDNPSLMIVIKLLHLGFLFGILLHYCLHFVMTIKINVFYCTAKYQITTAAIW